MSPEISHTSSLTKAIIIVEFVLVAYLIYSLTKNVYNSYLVDSYIDSFEQENSLLVAENRAKTEDYLYFTSEEYIDKIAKQNLGLVNSGEEVIIISPDSLTYDTQGRDGGEGLSDSELIRIETRSNPQLWLDFFVR
jgi:cell division protein FtsB